MSDLNNIDKDFMTHMLTIDEMEKEAGLIESAGKILQKGKSILGSFFRKKPIFKSVRRLPVKKVNSMMEMFSDFSSRPLAEKQAIMNKLRAMANSFTGSTNKQKAQSLLKVLEDKFGRIA